MIKGEEEIEFVPGQEKIVVQPWPSPNFLSLSSRTLNLCIDHPFVINFLLNKISNQHDFLPNWVSRVKIYIVYGATYLWYNLLLCVWFLLLICCTYFPNVTH
jgi:hypothetical protein